MMAGQERPRKSGNLKTALVLGGIALFFFVSVIAKFVLMG